MSAPTPHGHHVLRYQGVNPSGGEEWLCSACGRNLLVRWTPEFEQLVLVEGDVHASHAGSRNGQVGIRSVGARPDRDADGAWRRWLAQHDIEWDGP